MLLWSRAVALVSSWCWCSPSLQNQKTVRVLDRRLLYRKPSIVIAYRFRKCEKTWSSEAAAVTAFIFITSCEVSLQGITALRSFCIRTFSETSLFCLVTERAVHPVKVIVSQIFVTAWNAEMLISRIDKIYTQAWCHLEYNMRNRVLTLDNTSTTSEPQLSTTSQGEEFSLF